MKPITIKLICSLFLASTVFSTVAIAQEAEEEKTPNLAGVWVLTIKTGMFDQFMEALPGHMAYRAEKEDSRAWETYMPVLGEGIGSTVAFRYCCFDWADQDAYNAEATEKGFDEHWNANMSQFVAGVSHYLSYIDMENSNWGDEGGPFTYFGLSDMSIKPGKYADFEKMKAKFAQMAKEHKWQDNKLYWAWTSRIGGKPVETLIAPFKDYADMAPVEPSFREFVMETVGEEKAMAMFAKFSETIADEDYTVWKLLHEFSMSEDKE
jgi:hypothetical protein